MLSNNLIALGLTLIIALVWLRFNNFTAHKGWVSGEVSRKIIHIGTGPIFVLCWLLFSDSPTAPLIAAVVPLGITLQFALIGSGIMRDPSAVKAMSRTGDRREILRGPLYYGIVFVLLTVMFWRRTPVGIVGLMMLCGGDGLADIVGKRIGGVRLPWSKRKTLAGSVTMLLGGFLFTIAILSVFTSFGYFDRVIQEYFFPIGMIALAATLVESLPLTDIDNITVPLVSVLLGLLIL